MKINEAIALSKDYGANTTLGALVKQIQGNKIHKCPKCSGSGKVAVKYDDYPPGLPDSGWAHKWITKYVECDLCHGEGYTEHEYKPRMVQDGWE
ncbi:hypothetical protein B5F53_11935 [Blautia sp. An249]|uniref:hypothetical protein n=1 Tax=Blautia sp. An249 TaxID=1965603 RepID=UPI000B383654|nr:hypothetical protein [Blautia sp. An249]OUO77918.1 hypothetical protein B5F53_11935 [Blautia sp. An249]